jgi:hypothetical protein
VNRDLWKRHAAIIAKRKSKPVVDSTPDKANGHPYECDCETCLDLLKKDGAK